MAVLTGGTGSTINDRTIEGDEEEGRPAGRKKLKADLAGDQEDSSNLRQLVDDNKQRNTALMEQMKRKNDLIEEQLTVDLFKMDASSEESKAFFAFMQKKRLAAVVGQVAHAPDGAVAIGEVVTAGSVPGAGVVVAEPQLPPRLPQGHVRGDTNEQDGKCSVTALLGRMRSY